ncbi:MAG: sulfatase [Saprospiraceae bacterium]|nr:sulfatase [Saprospiraceae bacterium]
MLSVACLGSCGEAPTDNAIDKPNIIFILADDLGWRDVGFNGSQFYETPNLDRLAQEGIQFTNAYANAANCAPTRASIMSGQYTFRHKVYSVNGSDRGDKRAQELIPLFGIDSLQPQIITFPELLQEAGYYTAHFGKWHLGEGSISGPTAHGFHQNIGGWKRGSPRSYFSPYYNPTLEDGPNGEQLTDRLTDEVIAFLKQSKDSQKPFYVNFWTYGVHAPIQTTQALKEKYQAKEVVDEQNNPIYAGMVETLDRNIGRLVATLESTGLMENTILVFFSDNGGSWRGTSNKPLKGAKGTLYEGGIREPAFIYAPGIFEGSQQIDAPIISSDFYPTFLDWAGIDLPKEQALDGVSLTPLLNGGGIAERALFWYAPVYLPGGSTAKGAYAFRSIPSSALRVGHYKLMRFYAEEFDELYNLDSDREEQINLRDIEPRMYARLQKILDGFHQEHKVPIPSKRNPQYNQEHTVATYQNLRVK